MALGPIGNYEFIRHNGVIGAIMPKFEEMPRPMWTYYFRCADIDQAHQAITDNGGKVLNGPDEIPGGDYIQIGRAACRETGDNTVAADTSTGNRGTGIRRLTDVR